MAESVYILCALTSLGCAVLLLRGYAQTHVRLLLWSAICFLALTAENAMLFVDLVELPAVDLSLWRNALSVVGLMVLAYGMIWDDE